MSGKKVVSVESMREEVELELWTMFRDQVKAKKMTSQETKVVISGLNLIEKHIGNELTKMKLDIVMTQASLGKSPYHNRKLIKQYEDSEEVDAK